MQSWIMSIITPVFSVTSFRNYSNINLVLKKHFLSWKQLNILAKTDFQDSVMNKKNSIYLKNKYFIIL